MTGERSPMVRIASLWERESKAGRKYYSGFLGGAQLLMFRGDEITRDNGEIVQTWNLLVQERDQPARQQAERPQRLPGRGDRAWDAARRAGAPEPPDDWPEGTR